jgi:hypothetical protein
VVRREREAPPIGPLRARRAIGPLEGYYGGTTQLFDVGRYANGKRVGVWKTFHRDGRAKRVERFDARGKRVRAR